MGLRQLQTDEVKPMGGDVVSLSDEALLWQGETFAPSGEGLELPLSVDNSELPCFPPIGDQVPLPSCVSFAITYYQLTHNMGLYLGRNNKHGDGSTWYSPKWTYNFVNGGGPSGTSWTGTYTVLEKHGAVTWAEFPYDDDYLQWCTDTTAWFNALSTPHLSP